MLKQWDSPTFTTSYHIFLLAVSLEYKSLKLALPEHLVPVVLIIQAKDEEAMDEDCHILPLTGLNAFVYTGLNVQKL